MGKIMGILLGLIGIIIVFYMFPSLLTSLDNLKEESYSETFTNVTTGAGVTNASVTLTINLMDDSITKVETISSDLGEDNPSPERYITATDKLYVKGLAPNTSRNFTIAYKIDDLEEYEGMSEFTGLTPLLLIIGALGLVLVGVWRVFSGRGRH